MTPAQTSDHAPARPAARRRPELSVFAERLPRLRRAWDASHPYEPPMTQERLAERMEVDVRTVRQWERGTCAPRTFDRARRLAEVLEVPLERLGLSTTVMSTVRRTR
jgi:ribosome-binding protein aMBF1 (putative translation factor)